MAQDGDNNDLALASDGATTLPVVTDTSNTDFNESDSGAVAKPEPLIGIELARQLIIGATLFVAILLLVIILFWLNTPEKRPLATYETEELIPILDYLDQQKIGYKLEGNTVLVNSKEYAKIKLQLTRAGFSSVEKEGDEILLEDMGFGVSQQLERERLKLSRERQLAAAIEKIRAVSRARVLLAMPKQSVFVRHNQEATAAVFLTVKGNTQLGQEEVDAIVDMVASAVPNLNPARVTVTDQHGRLLSSGSQDLTATQHRKEYELELKQEQNLREKIDAILIPVLGIGNYTAQVDVALDFSAVEETYKKFDPSAPFAIRSEYTSENVNSSDLPLGIPGALSNQPPVNSAIPEDIQNLAQDNDSKGYVSREATRNYELDSSIRYRKGQTGVITRQTVSVAVDYLSNTNSETGEAVRAPVAEEELDKIRRLLMGGVGFSQARGDMLEVISVPFVIEEIETYVQPPIWDHPNFNDWVRWAIASLVIIVVILALLRPAFKKFTDTKVENVRIGSNGEILGLDGLPLDLDEDMGVELIGSDIDSSRFSTEATHLNLPDLDRNEDLFKAVRALVTNEPELAAQVVKGWMKNND